MAAKIEVRNPRSGKIDYWITPPTQVELRSQCMRLRLSQENWQQSSLQKRIEVIESWKEALLSQKDELISTLVTDTGRLSESITEFEGVVSTIDRWCRLAPELLSKAEEENTNIITEQLQDAVSKGAIAHCGGETD